MEKTPIDENWEMACRFEMIRGRPVVTEMTISLRDHRDVPDGGLTGRVLRRVSPLLAASEEGAAGSSGPETEALLSKIADELRGNETIGKGYPRPDSFYARVAQLYLLALQRSPRKPADFMAAEMVRRGVDVTVQMTRAWIRMARSRGWLVGGDQGTPGAEPGEKLSLWEEAEVNGPAVPEEDMEDLGPEVEEIFVAAEDQDAAPKRMPLPGTGVYYRKDVPRKASPKKPAKSAPKK